MGDKGYDPERDKAYAENENENNNNVKISSQVTGAAQTSSAALAVSTISPRQQLPSP